MAAEKSTARKKTKNTRLGNEAARLVFRRDLQERLRDCSIQVLKAVERCLKKANTKQLSGHPKKYPDSYADDVFKHVHLEIERQKALGKKGVGAKRAIRYLVRQRVIDEEGETALARQEARINKLTDDLFKTYEARRKRG